MQSLARAVAQEAVAGEPLPGVFPSLEHMGFRLRRAQVTMIAAAPNAGKSALALAWVKGLDLPSLTFSADTDQFTTALRAVAADTGFSMRTLEARVEREGRQVLADLAEDMDNLRFCFDPSPSLHDIDLEVRAFEEVWGSPPQVIVVDNLMNVLTNEGDEFRGFRVAMAELHDLARRSGACVIVLHHLSGEYDGTQDPPPRKAILGKITHLPEMILTLANREAYIGIACVKNRTGVARADGSMCVWLGFDGDRMLFNDPMRGPTT